MASKLGNVAKHAANVDWAALFELMPAARTQLIALKRNYEAVVRKRDQIQKEPEPINWEHYRAAVRTPGLVDNLENLFKNAKSKLDQLKDVSKHLQQFEHDLAKQKEELVCFLDRPAWLVF